MNRLNQVKRMTQMIQSTQSMDLIYQLNQLNQLNSIQYFVDLFWENHLFRWPFSEKTFDFFDLFWIFWINSIDSIKPVPKNLSTQSPILWKRIDSVTNQLTWEKTESTQSIFRKKWIDSSQSTQSSWIVYKSAHIWIQPLHAQELLSLSWDGPS